MHSDPAFHRHLIGWLWCAWALYWLVTAFSNKTTQRREPLSARLLHVVPLIVAGVLIGVHDMPWPVLMLRLWPRSLALYWLGVALLAAGLAFAVWARVHLGRNWSGSVTVKEGHELIRTGPYGYVRHPIYTGLHRCGAWHRDRFRHGARGAGARNHLVSLLRKLRTEEAFMRETFPGEYQRYSAAVPALIPFTRPRQSAPR